MKIIIQSGIRKSRDAFTLIEIMVATVIMVILVGLVIQITGEVLKVWNRSSGKLSANAEARIAMSLITQDLETAVIRNNGKQWLRVEAPAPSGGPYDNQTVALKLFSPALDRDQSKPGDICAIGYQLAYGKAYIGATDKTYALYRSLISPEDTFNKLLGPDLVDLTRQESLTGDGWDSIVDDNNYLVGNVIDFKVLLYANDGSGIANLVNANDTNLDLDPGIFSVGGDPGESEVLSDPLLFAEVSLTVVSDEGLKLLLLFDERGAFDQYNTPDDIVRIHGESYSRRVNFVASPL